MNTNVVNSGYRKCRYLGNTSGFAKGKILLTSILMREKNEGTIKNHE